MSCADIRSSHAHPPPCLERMRDVLRWLLAVVGCAVVVVAMPARADDELPGRVGRVASAQGALYHAPGENAEDWAEIGLNYPVAEGDNLWVQHDGHVEVDYGGGQLRLAGDTSLHVSRLDDRQLSLFIAAGRVIVRVRTLEPDDAVRIDTPATQIGLARPGLYRIDVEQDSPATTVIVREGEAQVSTATGTERLFPGQTVSVTGVANEQAQIRIAPGIDGFDAWSAARDRVYEQPRQYAYVSPQMVGAADLASYGTWQIYPEYGAVWFPTSVSPEWAPYRFGHWTWLSGWGYAWVDDAPWGYAPFHYGRWAHVGGRWGWCPGAVVARPLWAPALVAWYGGGRWSHSASGAPTYGWVPLGWKEPFVPSWGQCSSRCWARYNHPYGLSVAERRDVPRTPYANWGRGGATAVPGDALTGGKPVASNRVPLGSSVAFEPSLLARAPAIRPVAPVRPTVRPGNGAPLPASTLYTAHAPGTAPGTSGAGATSIAPPFRGPADVARGASAAGPAPVLPSSSASRGERAPLAPPSAASRASAVPVAPSRTEPLPRSVVPPATSRAPVEAAVVPRTVSPPPTLPAPVTTPTPATRSVPLPAIPPAPALPAPTARGGPVPGVPPAPATPAPATRTVPAPPPVPVAAPAVAPRAAVPAPEQRNAIRPVPPNAVPDR